MSEAAVTAAGYRRLMLGLLLAPALLWLIALIVLPHVDLALLSLRERVAPRQYVVSLAQYRAFFSEPLYWRVFVRTALLSALATALTLLVAFPIAWTIAKLARGRMSALLFVVCLIPFWVSETVRTLGWMILLRESGVLPALLVHLGLTAQPVELLYHDATILVGLVYTSLLFMVVPLVRRASRAWITRSSRPPTTPRRQGLGHPARDRDPACRARHHRRLHRGVHADARQLPDADAARRQELAVVHRADLHAVHHAIQLGAGGGLRLPVARAVSTAAMVWLGLKVSGQRFSDVMLRA